MSALLALEHVSVRFALPSPPWSARRARHFKAVDDVSLTINSGDAVGIVGESGSGKTTLARAMVALVRLADGEIYFEGTKIGPGTPRQMAEIRPEMQMVFQNAAGALDPRWRIGRSILESARLDHHHATFESPSALLQDALAQVGLDTALARRLPHEISGGQRQRVALARAIAASPRFVACDEPLSGLDVSAQGQIINLLRKLKESFGLTYALVGHDLSAIRLVCDRVVVMYCAQVVEEGTVQEVYERPRHPYTRALLSSMPTRRAIGSSGSKSLLMDGDLASPQDPPTGCRFHTRCWLYEQLGRPERCRTSRPAYETVAPGHRAACHFSADAISPNAPT